MWFPSPAVHPTGVTVRVDPSVAVQSVMMMSLVSSASTHLLSSTGAVTVGVAFRVYVTEPVCVHVDVPLLACLVAVKVMVWVGLLAKADLGHVTITVAGVVVLGGADGRQSKQQTVFRHKSTCVD